MTSPSRVVWFNGTLVPESEAKLSIYDSALMFGDMVFEMTRSFKKRQFKLREHLERLYASAKFVHIEIPMTMEEMEKHVEETIAANDPSFMNDDEHRVMIDVTRGGLGFYAGRIAGVEAKTNVIIADFPLRWTVASMGHLFETGINAVITSQRAIPASLLDPKVKNRSRLHYLMANIEVSRVRGEDNWALLLDPDGFIAEGTGDNIFIVKDGVLITPEGRNILRGISRQYIFELAKQLGMPCVEKNIEPYDMLTADESFMTGTPFCLLPVTTLGGQIIGTGTMGPVTKKLLSAWSKNVGLDIVAQIEKYEAASRKEQRTKAPTPYQFTAPTA